MNSAWKIGVNSHASGLIGLAPGAAGSSGAWLGVGVTVGGRRSRVPPSGEHAATIKRERNEEQDRREADEGLAEAGHAVLSRLGQRTGS